MNYDEELYRREYEKNTLSRRVARWGDVRVFVLRRVSPKWTVTAQIAKLLKRRRRKNGRTGVARNRQRRSARAGR
jgi:hypothetical protein